MQFQGHVKVNQKQRPPKLVAPTTAKQPTDAIISEVTCVRNKSLEDRKATVNSGYTSVETSR